MALGVPPCLACLSFIQDMDIYLTCPTENSFWLFTPAPCRGQGLWISTNIAPTPPANSPAALLATANTGGRGECQKKPFLGTFSFTTLQLVVPCARHAPPALVSHVINLGRRATRSDIAPTYGWYLLGEHRKGLFFAFISAEGCANRQARLQNTRRRVRRANY